MTAPLAQGSLSTFLLQLGDPSGFALRMTNDGVRSFDFGFASAQDDKKSRLRRLHLISLGYRLDSFPSRGSLPHGAYRIKCEKVEKTS